MADVKTIDEALERALRPVDMDELNDCMQKLVAIMNEHPEAISAMDFAKINYQLNTFIDLVKETCIKASLHNNEPNS